MEISDKLARFIQIPSLLIMAVFFVILTFFMMIQSHNKTEMLISQLQKDFAVEQKRHLRIQALQLALHMKYQSEAFYDDLAVSMQERVDEAVDIASEIYRKNKGRSKKRIRSLIVSVLRNIRFNNGRGYYFIYSSQGEVVMLPLAPEMEGVSGWDEQDEDENYFVRELINKARNADRSLLEWSYPKQDGHNSEEGDAYTRVGSAFYFAPCDIIIGTADDIDGLTKSLQQRLLQWAERGQRSRFEHLFVFNEDGEVLSNSSGFKLMERELCDQHGKEIVQFRTISELENGEGFLTHLCSRQEEEIEMRFFLKTVPKWHWVVGALEDTEAVDRHLSPKIAVIKQQNRASLVRLLIGCMIIMGLGAWFINYQSRRVSRYVYKKMMFDDLSGLPNRNYFAIQVQMEIEAGRTVVVLNVDIDEFSAINEWFGRDAGDLLLCDIVERLRTVVDTESQLCRVSSDEFLVYFKEEEFSQLGRIDSFSYIQIVRNALTKPFFIGNVEVKITCAIGAVSSQNFKGSVNGLLRRANIVLFRMKNEGRGQHGCYDLAIEKSLQRNKVIADTLATALANNEFHIVYQPQFLSRNRKIFGVEALCRWNSSSLGSVTPDEFIPIAEKSGFILPLGFYIFRKACEDVFTWMENGKNAVRVSINISPRQLLHTSFVSEIQKIIENIGIESERITLEITENLLFTDLEAVKPILENLDKLGFEISLDDFGTGASSLVHVHKLPIHELKIDRTFVAKINNTSQAASLVKSILAISNSNSLRIVAEGVETKEHISRLEADNCDLFQGYFFSEPLDISELKNKFPLRAVDDSREP